MARICASSAAVNDSVAAASHSTWSTRSIWPYSRSVIGSSSASLHTKAFVVDGRYGFVGSFNFDPRSVSLNTEMGLLFEHAELAREMQAVFAEEIAEKRSYRLVLSGDAVRWQDGGGRLLGSEPDASLRRRLVAGMISFLPVESQL